MKVTTRNILRLPWKYFISRNLAVWHNELGLRFEARGFQSLKLPGIFQIYVHRGTHSEFFWLETGPNSRQVFAKVLLSRLHSPHYVSFLRRRYHTDGRRLLQLAKELRPTVGSLQHFFRWYGLRESMLDVTAVASKVVTDEVLRLVPASKHQLDIISYYSQPRQLSPVQRLERELAILSKQKSAIHKYAAFLHRKYCWIPINFVGEPWDVSYFIKRLRSYRPRPTIHVTKPTQPVPAEAKRLLHLLALIADLNEYRKGIFTQANYLVRPVFDAMAKSHGLSGWRDLNLLTSDEIIDLVHSRDDYQHTVIRKRKGLFMLYNETIDSAKIISGSIVNQLLGKYQARVQGVREVTGVSAHRGVVRGTLKIIIEPKDFIKFKHGDIIVAKMTSIDFVPIMRKAGAFVTDEGGLASHAAIIAREYGKPCIVGTKIGTRVLKDGDKVEVDATNGVIRKI